MVWLSTCLESRTTTTGGPEVTVVRFGWRWLLGLVVEVGMVDTHGAPSGEPRRLTEQAVALVGTPALDLQASGLLPGTGPGWGPRARSRDSRRGATVRRTSRGHP